MSTMSSVYVTDGAKYIHSLAEQYEGGQLNTTKWSYVIQDCFTGGSVPAELFTLEFWGEVGTLMERDGIVAMVREI